MFSWRHKKNIYLVTYLTILSRALRKHTYIMLTPLKPHFYIVKLRFMVGGGGGGAHYFFLFLLKNIDCGYSLEPPQQGGSNEYPQSKF